ncbi:MAG TPA: helix-turn-helix domain-containing protein [Anaeromyxobacteraceae bacterium]|nr:helix-turn-helix domain-containing protein [Anaeromyxobacteraceae bacterium]
MHGETVGSRAEAETELARLRERVRELETKTASAMGRRGGLKVRETYGVEHYQRIGRIGGSRVAAARGREFYAKIGRKGGQTVKERRGSEFFAEIGAKGGQRVKETHDEDYYATIARERRSRLGRSAPIPPGPGARLREARLGAHLSQAELGDIVGHCQTTISLFETGRRALAGYEAIFARALGLDPEMFAASAAKVVAEA